jgi:hypothetical protein
MLENVWTNELVTNDTTPHHTTPHHTTPHHTTSHHTTPHVYRKAMLAVAFESSMWIITIP